MPENRLTSAADARTGHLDTTGFVPAVGTRRRLQALAALGYSSADVVRSCGVSKRAVDGAKGGHRDQVRADIDASVRRAYAALAPLGISRSRFAEQTRSVARRNGWVPPLAWESDAAMDDPEASPDAEAVL